MLNSRNIDDLRPDVAANCRVWMELCKKAGLPVLVTGTVRDEEYQLYCYNNGTSKAKVPSFHSVDAGLAFDFCKNIKGHEYDDLAFFDAAAAIAKEMGFDWGGDWTSFPDRPHLQWSARGAYTSAMVRAGHYPPAMPLYRRPSSPITGSSTLRAPACSERKAATISTCFGLPRYPAYTASKRRPSARQWSR